MSDNRFASGVAIENPLQFFDFTLPAGTVSEPLYFNYDYFRLLDLSGNSVLVQFGASGSPARFLSAGIGFKVGQDKILNFLQFRNDTGGVVAGRVALAIGDITDDRLSLSGNVSVVNAVGTQLETYDRQSSTFAVSQQSMVAATAAQIFATDATAKARVITAGNQDLYIGVNNTVTTANGFKIGAGQSFTLPHGLETWGICAADDTIFKYGETY